MEPERRPNRASASHHVPITLSGKVHGTGTLYALSTDGCKVETGNAPPLGARSPSDLLSGLTSIPPSPPPLSGGGSKTNNLA